jgi:hypothetical protein
MSTTGNSRNNVLYQFWRFIVLNLKILKLTKH